MAITTLDGLIAGMLPPEPVVKAAFTGEASGLFHTPFYLAGRPGAAVAPTPGLAGAALTSYAGQIPFPAAVGGKNIYLAGLGGVQAGNVGAAYLMDRLWHNSGIVVTTTTAQTINSVAWPARDQNGSTNGVGVMVGIEVSTATTNAGAVTTITMSYTNQAGTAGQVATIPNFPATAVAGTFVPFMLAAGDTGVRSIQSITLGTTLTAGTIHLVAYRQCAWLAMGASNVGVDKDGVQLGFPRMFDNSVPFFLYNLLGTAGGTASIQVLYSQG